MQIFINTGDYDGPQGLVKRRIQMTDRSREWRERNPKYTQEYYHKNKERINKNTNEYYHRIGYTKERKYIKIYCELCDKTMYKRHRVLHGNSIEHLVRYIDKHKGKNIKKAKGALKLLTEKYI